MTRYFFDLSDGAGGARDDRGTELPDHRAAVVYGHEIVHDLMRNNEQRSRRFCISVRGVTEEPLFRIPFIAIHESPESRMMLELGDEHRRPFDEAVPRDHTVRPSRAVGARSRGKPYLAAVNGQTRL